MYVCMYVRMYVCQEPIPTLECTRLGLIPRPDFREGIDRRGEGPLQDRSLFLPELPDLRSSAFRNDSTAASSRDSCLAGGILVAFPAVLRWAHVVNVLTSCLIIAAAVGACGLCHNGHFEQADAPGTLVELDNFLRASSGLSGAGATGKDASDRTRSGKLTLCHRTKLCLSLTCLWHLLRMIPSSDRTVAVRCSSSRRLTGPILAIDPTCFRYFRRWLLRGLPLAYSPLQSGASLLLTVHSVPVLLSKLTATVGESA